tara:strand:+ start:776 stop:1174 length:399 start_codon:yes stop_codon:yes gene_type:complete
VAKGLGGLLGVGREQKRQALAGLTRAAQLETQTDTINRQLKAQKRAAEMNVLGTAGGIVGAQVLTGGIKFGAKAAAEGAAAGAAAKGAGAAAAGGAAAGGAASAGMMAGMAAAAPYVLLAIAGGYLLKKIFD